PCRRPSAGIFRVGAGGALGDEIAADRRRRRGGCREGGPADALPLSPQSDEHGEGEGVCRSAFAPLTFQCEFRSRGIQPARAERTQSCTRFISAISLTSHTAAMASMTQNAKASPLT